MFFFFKKSVFLVLILQSNCFFFITSKRKQIMEQQPHRTSEWTKSNNNNNKKSHVTFKLITRSTVRFSPQQCNCIINPNKAGFFEANNTWLIYYNIRSHKKLGFHHLFWRYIFRNTIKEVKGWFHCVWRQGQKEDFLRMSQIQFSLIKKQRLDVQNTC